MFLYVSFHTLGGIFYNSSAAGGAHGTAAPPAANSAASPCGNMWLKNPRSGRYDHNDWSLSVFGDPTPAPAASAAPHAAATAALVFFSLCCLYNSPAVLIYSLVGCFVSVCLSVCAPSQQFEAG